MKRIFAPILSIALCVFLLTGCGNGGDSQATPTPSPSASPEVTASPTPAPSSDATTPEPESQQPSETDTPVSKPTAKPQSNNSQQSSGGTAQQGGSNDYQAPSQPQQPSEPQQPDPTQAPAPPASVPVSTVMSAMIGAMDSSTHNLTQMPSELYAGVYQIDPANFEEVLIYGSAMSTRANEIIVIKATDQANLNQAVAALQNRKAMQEKQYQNYLADQYELVKQGTVTTQGLYATLVIAEQSSSAVSAFQNAI